MLRLYASDPLYSEWNELLTAYAALLNPACHWNTREVVRDSPEYRADLAVWRQRVMDEFEEMTR